MKFLIGGWAIAVVLGFAAMSRYESTAGRQIQAPSALSASRDGRPTLTVFIHPECGCTSATLGELERIQAQTLGRLNIVVDAVIPSGEDGWKKAGNVVRAEANRSWRVVLDPNGKIAAACGAQTSGFCLLTDRAGHKLFQGGITISRGHEGDNPGHDAIVSYVRNGTISIKETPVFGCSLGSLGAL